VRIIRPFTNVARNWLAQASYTPRSRCCSEYAPADVPGSWITSAAGGGVSATRAPYAEKLIVPSSLMRRISGLLEIET
jgi:hypothetical protein